MSATMETDVAGFLGRIAPAIEDVTVRCESELVKMADQVVTRARDLCPVATGTLQASIHHLAKQRDSHGPYIEILADAPYAIYVEFGTSRMRAQPFMRPALAEAHV